MSDTHWSIRVLVFAGLTWLGVKIAQLIKWLFSFQWWVYVIAGIVLVGIIILIYYIKSRISENTASPTTSIEPPKVETTVQTEEKEEPQFQMSFESNSREYIMDRLRTVDINTLTPIEAMGLLYELIDKAKN